MRFNVAFGYGAEGMLGASSNENVIESDIPQDIERYRQFYFAPDIDLTKIPTKSGAVKSLFGIFGFLKIPAPTLEVNGNGKLKMHWLYF